jgi:Reverse transcriptase (RNA-dependent DNA polymerase)
MTFTISGQHTCHIHQKKRWNPLTLCRLLQTEQNNQEELILLPQIDKLLDQLLQAKLFSKIDLKSRYNLVCIADGDEWKIAFCTCYGSYESLVMHFGLTNAPTTFQNFMNNTFHDLLNQFVTTYLNDLIIYTESDCLEEHITQVCKVLLQCQKDGLFVNMKKCEFHVNIIEYVGYIVSPAGLSMEPTKIRAIEDWPVPHTIKEVQSFLGFANFY